MAISIDKVIQSNFKPNISGFSLIELIVVLAGLGILSSLTIPNLVDLFESNNVDEIKALLNSAAADCLQKKRSETDPIVDDQIISDPIIESRGYKIDRTNSILSDNKPKCSQLLLEPIRGDKEDRVRYNIGFMVLSDGRLDKLASTEAAKKKADCIKWAGKCEFSEDAKILEEYKNEIRAAKAACDSEFQEWKKTMNPSEFKRWDSSMGPDTCPLSPPGGGDTSYKGSATCSTLGCIPGIKVWGLWNDETNSGTTYSSKNAYDNALEIMIGAACAKQIKEEYEDKNFTNSSSAGVPLSQCKNESYWFVDGKNMGSAEKWSESMCEKNKKALLNTTHSGPVEHCGASPVYICGGQEILGARDVAESHFKTCLANDKNAQCTQSLNDHALKQEYGGPYTSPTPSNMSHPIGDDCNIQYYYCKEIGKIYRDKNTFNNDESCPTKDCGTPPYDACNYPAYYDFEGCIEYNTCMGRL